MRCLLISAAAVLIAGAGACRAGSTRVVEVCLEKNQLVGNFVMARAQVLAAAMFAGSRNPPRVAAGTSLQDGA